MGQIETKEEREITYAELAAESPDLALQLLSSGLSFVEHSAEETGEEFDVESIRAGVDGQVRFELTDQQIAATINSQLRQITARDLEEIVSEFPEEQQSLAIDVLLEATHFASFGGLAELSKEIAGRKLTGKKSLFRPGPAGGSLSQTLHYLRNHKDILPGGRVSLESSLESSDILVLDNATLAYLERTEGSAEIVKSKKLLLPVGFDTGIGLFSNGSKEELALKVHTLVDQLVELRESTDSSASVEDLLRSSVDQRLRAIAERDGVYPEALVSAVSLVKGSGSTGLFGNPLKKAIENLNDSQGVSSGDIADAFGPIPAGYQGEAAELTVRTSEVFSQRRITADLRALHQKIVEQAAEKGIPEENIILWAPDASNSFSVMGLAYKQANGIPEDRVLSQGEISSRELGEDYAVVVVDDVAGSGSTLNSYSSTLREMAGKAHRFVASMVGTPKAITYISDPPSDERTVICCNLVDGIANTAYFSTLSDDQRKAFELVMGGTGFGSLGLAVSFPYMSPDNNSGLWSTRFADKFTLNKESVKKSHWSSPAGPVGDRIDDERALELIELAASLEGLDLPEGRVEALGLAGEILGACDTSMRATRLGDFYRQSILTELVESNVIFTNWAEANLDTILAHLEQVDLTTDSEEQALAHSVLARLEKHSGYNPLLEPEGVDRAKELLKQVREHILEDLASGQQLIVEMLGEERLDLLRLSEAIELEVGGEPLEDSVVRRKQEESHAFIAQETLTFFVAEIERINKGISDSTLTFDNLKKGIEQLEQIGHIAALLDDHDSSRAGVVSISLTGVQEEFSNLLRIEQIVRTGSAPDDEVSEKQLLEDLRMLIERGIYLGDSTRHSATIDSLVERVIPLFEQQVEDFCTLVEQGEGDALELMHQAIELKNQLHRVERYSNSEETFEYLVDMIQQQEQALKGGVGESIINGLTEIRGALENVSTVEQLLEYRDRVGSLLSETGRYSLEIETLDRVTDLRLELGQRVLGIVASDSEQYLDLSGSHQKARQGERLRGHSYDISDFYTTVMPPGDARDQGVEVLGAYNNALWHHKEYLDERERFALLLADNKKRLDYKTALGGVENDLTRTIEHYLERLEESLGESFTEKRREKILSSEQKRLVGMVAIACDYGSVLTPAENAARVHRWLVLAPYKKVKEFVGSNHYGERSIYDRVGMSYYHYWDGLSSSARSILERSDRLNAGALTHSRREREVLREAVLRREKARKRAGKTDG